MFEARDELSRARATLVAAELADRPAERYLTAYQAVGQVAAVALRTRGTPVRPPRRNIWQLVAQVAPELAEWAGYFHALQGKRSAVQAGAANLVSPREADDLIRDGHTFAGLVEKRLDRAGRTAGARPATSAPSERRAAGQS